MLSKLAYHDAIKNAVGFGVDDLVGLGALRAAVGGGFRRLRRPVDGLFGFVGAGARRRRRMNVAPGALCGRQIV